jgi:hypothetical protein
MTDCVEMNFNKMFISVSKEKAIGHDGVYCVGSSRDYFKYVENENYFGIEVHFLPIENLSLHLYLFH